MATPQTAYGHQRQTTIVQIEIEHHAIVRIRREAARREVPVVRLIHDLLAIIGEEPCLVGAILDDGDVPLPPT